MWIKHFMKITRFQFYLLILCQAVETLTDQQTDLGQNVTINCDLNVKEVYWLLLKLPHPPVTILRYFSSAPYYYNTRFKQKYSLLSKYDLFINNVTLDELGVYYCLSTDTMDKRFSNGTRLHISEPTPESQNRTVAKPSENTTQSHSLIFIIISGLMNAVLIVVVIGLFKVFVVGSKKTSENSKTSQDNSQQPPVIHLEQPQDSSQAEYAEVNFPTPCKRFQSSNDNSTYALIQLPK